MTSQSWFSRAMHCLTLFSLCVALKSTLIASETEDLFSSNPSFSADIAFNADLFSTNTEQTISNLNDPTSSPNELIFDYPSLDDDSNIPLSNLDSYPVSSNDGFDDTDIASSVLLQSSCQDQGDGQINNVLRARGGGKSCKTENSNIPLDFGTDSWWRRLFPDRKPSSSPGTSPQPGDLEPQNVPLISPDMYREFFNEVDEEKKCPKEFPIRCCSGYVMGQQGGFQVRTVYFIDLEDCVLAPDIAQCHMKYDACCQNSESLDLYNCILMGYDPLSIG